MKVLFISSGNKNTGEVGILVRNQANSLIKEGVEVDFFLIKGKGFWGYIKNIPKIRKAFLKGSYSLIHAHYSLSAFAASLSGCFPIVVSLMGSDAYMSLFYRVLAKVFYLVRWKRTIVKTERMKVLLKMKQAVVLPNGVDVERFKPIPKEIAREKIGYTQDSKLVIFIADPSRAEKNFELAQKSFDLLKDKVNNVVLMTVYNKPNSLIPYYLNSADALLLTSKWEGSVNVVKEAMACNLPIISTDVGDVKSNINGVENCYICSFNPMDIADKLELALNGETTSNGRDILLKKGLDSRSIARKIIRIYEDIVSK
ncbi:glycosyltransferase family 4 protein [Tenuifilum thalassicum]|uniref:Glycosyltransferase family 4 protein n=1 Tax=Tenuifilum thalassicum TaxID=2590900 RepID=A0A7D4BCJ8_9BACT|nr:glycosyltransferase family 4 protein [Tenuifilum thalassicum]QKG78803.1 glycosyltransferase family 4 protein [Tenuifilum thalassicum]